MAYEIAAGKTHPLGATPDAQGVNFSLYSESASRVELLLFEKYDDIEPVQIIQLDPLRHRTFCFWHIYVRWLSPGVYYAFRVDGPRNLSDGHRFNPNKVLIDPYARAVSNHLWQRTDASGEQDNLATSLRAVAIDISDYDWEGDRPISRPLQDLVIYEMHVGGFTKSPTAKVKHPGTFAGVIEKIPYLKDLGINAVELLPVMQFDDREVLRVDAEGKSLRNYWGYRTMSFFAPHGGYCVSPATGAQVNEFRDMVKALHRAGIEVILDVSFNHTSEGNHEGPWINFKGLANSAYYHLREDDRQYYVDYSGCGNTLNTSHPIVQKYLVECLQFWVEKMHVDGFRFNEGSLVARGDNGQALRYPPVLWSLELLEVFADTKLIAEAWAPADDGQDVSLPRYRWAEWNARYRDDVRRFFKGDGGMVGSVVSRIAGSADLYQQGGRSPANSINFLTCHDGFTLNDLVSYSQKHNEANGEGNRDGTVQNYSWNCGVEGETESAEIDAIRLRQIKNLFAILLLSRGVPMFSMGDEIRRTQQGNNNAYCQDNEISWFDWTLLEKNKELHRFCKQMIEFRKAHEVLRRPSFFDGSVNERGLTDVAWHGCDLHKPGWNDPGARALAFTLAGFDHEHDLHVMMNMYWDKLTFDLPRLEGRTWYIAVDTGKASPQDISQFGREPRFTDKSYQVRDRSVAVLLSK